MDRTAPIKLGHIYTGACLSDLVWEMDAPGDGLLIHTHTHTHLYIHTNEKYHWKEQTKISK